MPKKVDESMKLSMEALIRAHQNVSYARNMSGNDSNYADAIAAIEREQDSLLGKHPQEMTKEEKAEMYPALAERLGIQKIDK
jgi:hypothetical protein